MVALPTFETNSSFSTSVPGLQVAWDSTSMRTLMECPRKYQLSILEGMAPHGENIHLTFGLLYHAALEIYDHLRAQGQSHTEATAGCVLATLKSTWDQALRRPWTSMDSNKNRYTLLRTVVWYLDQFADDPIKTILLDNGKPAVEMSFRFELNIKARSTAEDFLYCGHMDRMGVFQDQTWIIDRKTTKHTIGIDFFTRYRPDYQFQGYVFAGQVAFATPVVGLIVDAAQVAVGFSRLARGIVTFDEATLKEWYRDTLYYLNSAEAHALSEYWPQNRTACGNYGGCPFRSICGESPKIRGRWSQTMTTRKWDPLQVRGDI